MFIDTHCHLQDPRYKKLDLDEVIKRAKDNNVMIMIISGYDIKSNQEAVDIANRYEGVYATVGYHPEAAGKIDDLDLKKLETLAQNEKVVAIGEIGLDYHYENTKKEEQQELFISQLQLANKMQKPVVIHSRDSANDTYNILKEYKDINIKGVLHCYASSYEMALKFSELNIIFGIGGVLTYKNSQVLKDVVRQLEMDKLILETDAPYLSPEPKRGKINEPSNIPLIAEKIAEIKGTNIENVMALTTANVKLLFDI